MEKNNENYLMLNKLCSTNDIWLKNFKKIWGKLFEKKLFDRLRLDHFIMKK
jgi:hypothetical protein